ncbi:ribosome maturation factor RimM [Lacticaseibacillus yichunensis]|uniref:Ribosome maturation factor RimM n=1 Tax=Lacticaseibacillus yichunensis TaxID=2486015 RepID=A0ABW4CQA5_9LACO|nr:ribosome maturation factor RimM [Lacticaseibacillus yichunensis]
MGETNRFKVGKIVNTHGVRGELKVITITDFPAQRFAKNSVLYVDTKPEQKLTVTGARPQKGTLLVTFAEITDMTAAEALKGCTLSTADESRDALADGEYFYRDLIGLTVIDQAGETLGQVSEILSPGANDVWVIPRPGKTDILLPFIQSVVLTIDLATKTAHVDVPAGLIDDAD